MPEAIAAVLLGVVAWDGWRRWLAHRAADYEQRIADLHARHDSMAESVEEIAARIKRVTEQVNGIVMRTR